MGRAVHTMRIQALIVTGSPLVAWVPRSKLKPTRGRDGLHPGKFHRVVYQLMEVM